MSNLLILAAMALLSARCYKNDCCLLSVRKFTKRHRDCNLRPREPGSCPAAQASVPLYVGRTPVDVRPAALVDRAQPGGARHAQLARGGGGQIPGHATA